MSDVRWRIFFFSKEAKGLCPFRKEPKGIIHFLWRRENEPKETSTLTKASPYMVEKPRAFDPRRQSDGDHENFFILPPVKS